MKGPEAKKLPICTGCGGILGYKLEGGCTCEPSHAKTGRTVTFYPASEGPEITEAVEAVAELRWNQRFLGEPWSQADPKRRDECMAEARRYLDVALPLLPASGSDVLEGQVAVQFSREEAEHLFRRCTESTNAPKVNGYSCEDCRAIDAKLRAALKDPCS